MKKILSLFIATIILSLSVGFAHAASTSIRLHAPQTPTRDKELTLTFVALDIEGRSISVECFYKRPDQSSFSKFDTTKYLQAGGDTTSCLTTHNHISPLGTYEFYAQATAGSDVVKSSTVSVDYDNQTPGKPTNYMRQKIGSCTQRITFRSPSDSDVTKIEIFRSGESSFSLEDSKRIGEVAVGPDQDGQFDSNPPECEKTYYYAIRAVDSSGNASDGVGDVGSTTTTETVITQAESIGAIPVSQSSVGQGQILGDADGGTATDSDQISEEVDSEDSDQGGSILGVVSENKPLSLIIGITLVLIGYRFYRKRQK